ncbi:MAG: hypothetical protein SNJ81_17525, partial [Cyanobacteriota bacterium]
ICQSSSIANLATLQQKSAVGQENQLPYPTADNSYGMRALHRRILKTYGALNLDLVLSSTLQRRIKT